MMEVDHDLQQVFVDKMQMLDAESIQYILTRSDAVTQRLTSPIVTTYVDTDKISFERYFNKNFNKLHLTNHIFLILETRLVCGVGVPINPKQ